MDRPKNVPANAVIGTLNADAAKRIGLQAGQQVYYTLKPDSQKPDVNRGKKAAQDVWDMSGKFIANTVYDMCTDW